MTPAEKYVAGAYLVVFVVVLAYVLIIATKLARLEREIAELTDLARRRAEQDSARDASEPLDREVPTLRGTVRCG